MPTTIETPKFVLVYQRGIANVFRVDSLNLTPYGRQAIRAFQGSYERAEAVALGLKIAGCTVGTCHCDLPGDVVDAKWRFGKGDFRAEHKKSIFSGVNAEYYLAFQKTN